MSFWRSPSCVLAHGTTLFPQFFLQNPDGEVQELPHRRVARGRGLAREQGAVSGSEQRESCWQPRVHAIPTRCPAPDRTHVQTGCPELAARGTVLCSGLTAGPLPRAHVPNVGPRRAAPRLLQQLLTPADLPRAPEGGGVSGLSAAGALDPRGDHDSPAPGLQLWVQV